MFKSYVLFQNIKIRGYGWSLPNTSPKQPPYYKVMIYSKAVVPCEDFEGSNFTLGVFICEIFTKTYDVNSELPAISTTFSLNLLFCLSLYQYFDKLPPQMSYISITILVGIQSANYWHSVVLKSIFISIWANITFFDEVQRVYNNISGYKTEMAESYTLLSFFHI